MSRDEAGSRGILHQSGAAGHAPRGQPEQHALQRLAARPELLEAGAVALDHDLRLGEALWLDLLLVDGAGRPLLVLAGDADLAAAIGRVAALASAWHASRWVLARFYAAGGLDAHAPPRFALLASRVGEALSPLVPLLEAGRAGVYEFVLGDGAGGRAALGLRCLHASAADPSSASGGGVEATVGVGSPTLVRSAVREPVAQGNGQLEPVGQATRPDVAAASAQAAHGEASESADAGDEPPRSVPPGAAKTGKRRKKAKTKKTVKAAKQDKAAKQGKSGKSGKRGKAGKPVEHGEVVGVGLADPAREQRPEPTADELVGAAAQAPAPPSEADLLAAANELLARSGASAACRELCLRTHHSIRSLSPSVAVGCEQGRMVFRVDEALLARLEPLSEVADVSLGDNSERHFEVRDDDSFHACLNAVFREYFGRFARRD